MTMDRARSPPPSSSSASPPSGPGPGPGPGPSSLSLGRPPQPVHRAKISCIPCRKRKTKCDGEKPCSSCILRESSQHCQYPTEGEVQHPQIWPSQSSSATQQAAQRRVKREYSREGASAPMLDRDKWMEKRRRGSSNGNTTDSVLPLDGTATDNDLDHILDGLLEHVDSVKRAVSAHRCQQAARNGEQPQQQRHYSRPLLHPPQHRCSATLLHRIVALLPPQVDCEVMLEYLVQEPDWFVVSVTAPYLLPIWSRFIYGARLRDVEVIVLAAAISVAATLLNEYPHAFYPLTAPLDSLASDLMDLVFYHIRYTPRARIHHGGLRRQDVVDEMVVSGLSLDYLRFSRKRSDAWIWFREHLTLHIETFELMNDETSSTWQSFDALERDMVRRVLWHTILTARMSHLYKEHPDILEIRPEHLKIERPQFPGPLSSPGLLVFTASAIGLNKEEKIQLRAPKRAMVRLHIEKTTEDIERSAKCQELSIQLTSNVPAIRSYVSAFKSWQTRRFKTVRGKAGRQKNAGGPKSLDYQREDLLHQALSLTRDIKHWRETCVLKEVPRLTRLDERADYLTLRGANRSSLLHVAIIQCLNAILTPWLTEDVGNNDGSSDSPLLTEVQREAYDNVREIVASIDATRTMITSGMITYFGSFAAYAFFYAAVSLAVPLVGGRALRQEPREAKGRYGDIILLDRYTDLKFQQEGSGNGLDTDGVSSTEEEHGSSSYPAPATSLHFTPTDLRGMAADLIKILDVLPIFRASPLCSEARQRLSYLVETFKIKRRAEGTETIPEIQAARAAAPVTLSPPFTFDPFGLSVFGDGEYSELLGSSRLPTTTGVTAAARPDDSLWSGSTPTASSSSTTGDISASSHAALNPTPPSYGGEMIDSLIQMDYAWWEDLLGTAATVGGGQQQG